MTFLQADESDSVITYMQVVDLLVAMCRAALESSRKSIIFDPYPSVVDPIDPKALAFNPKVQDLIHAITAEISVITKSNFKKKPSSNLYSRTFLLWPALLRFDRNEAMIDYKKLWTA